MENSKKKNSTTRFLICSFIGLLIFSIIIFSLLGVYMSRKSKNTVYEIGNIYMSGMNEQIFRHFMDNPYSHLIRNLLLKHYYKESNESLWALMLMEMKWYCLALMLLTRCTMEIGALA